MDQFPRPTRQQKLEFAETRIWKQLPVSVRQDCQQRLAGLLEEILKSEPIEVVIADQRMPGRTGVAFFEDILEVSY